MDRKCSKCGGELLEGTLVGSVHGDYLIYLLPEDLNKLKKRKSALICDACVECGNVESLRLEDPSKFRKK